MMRKKLTVWLLAPLFALSMAACSVEQTEEGEAPDIDVDPGSAPAYEVEPADVDVGTDTSTVVTPDIDVNPPADTARTP